MCHEFEVQLEMQNVERARNIVSEISEYSSDEQVKFEFTRILSQRGLLDEAMPIDKLTGAPPEQAEPPSESKLILPS